MRLHCTYPRHGYNRFMLRKYAVAMPLLLLASAFALGQSDYAVDPQRSVLRIKLGKSGLFGFLGDEHLIEARVGRGSIRHAPENLTRGAVQLEIPAASLRVLDPNLSENDRAEVQATMESDRVLDVESHRLIRFDSTKVEKRGNELIVTGNLTLRDRTRPVRVRCRLEQEGETLKVTGEAKFKQKDFGIEPVAAGLGTVKVKNEIRLVFEIYASPASGPGAH